MAAPDAASVRRRPLVALVLVAAGAGIFFLPRVGAALAFERSLVPDEPWRLLTGHLVHANASLARLDLAVLAVLGAWWELRSRVAFVAILLASAVSASLAVLVFTSFERYTGSSALGSGLFVAAALELLLERRGPVRVACAVALALFVAKCALEAAGRGALFASLPSGLEVAAAAHAAGGACGTLVVLVRRESGQRHPRGL